MIPGADGRTDAEFGVGEGSTTVFAKGSITFHRFFLLLVSLSKISLTHSLLLLLLGLIHARLTVNTTFLVVPGEKKNQIQSNANKRSRRAARGV